MGPQRRVTFDQFTDAWNALTKNIGIYAVCILIFGVIYCLFVIPVTIMLNAAMMADIGPAMQQNPWAQFTHPLYYAQTVYTMIISAFLAPLGVGISRMALRSMRGESIDIGMMFQLDGKYGHLLVFSLILSFAGTIGFYLCCIPGLIIYALMLPGGLLILEKGLTGMEALQTSAKDMMPSLGSAILLVLIGGIVAVAGAIACGVGILFTAGIWYCIQAAAYRELYDYGQPMPVDPGAPGSYYRPPPQG